MKSVRLPSPFRLPLSVSAALFALAGSVAFAAEPASPAAATPPAPSLPAPKPASKGSVKAYPLDVCLVTDNDLGSMGDEQRLVYENQEVKFCCQPCETKFLKNPSRYLKKLDSKPATDAKIDSASADSVPFPTSSVPTSK